MGQVLIATATLAWGVNTPAHLVVIKGTEYYDGKTHRYKDFPVTGQCSPIIEHSVSNCDSHHSVCNVRIARRRDGRFSKLFLADV